MNKIIYLSTKYLSETDFERAGIYKYLKNKINVEIWYLNKLVAKYYNNKEFRFKKLIIKKISNFEQFENELKKNSFNCIYDLRVAYYFQNKKIFQTLSKYNINYIVHIRGDIHKHKISLKNFIKKIIKGNFTHLKLIFFNLFFLLFSSNFWNIRKAKYACFIGKYGYLKREKHKLIDNQTRFIMGQHRDYDDYLKINSKTLNTKNKKVLFIDSAIPYHPDSKYNIGSSSDVNPEEYYSSIKFFLEKLRKSFDYKIEISCHPRIEIKKLKKHFPNFVIKRKETINQIRYSKLIITHDSNAINFAVLYKKRLFKEEFYPL